MKYEIFTHPDKPGREMSTLEVKLLSMCIKENCLLTREDYIEWQDEEKEREKERRERELKQINKERQKKIEENKGNGQLSLF
jgi:hypothetical protein